MSAEAKKHTVTVQITSVVAPAWIELCCEYSDMFMHDYIGYWGRGIRLDKKTWLVWEYENDADLSEKENEEHLAKAKVGWKEGVRHMFKNYHVLDEKTCIKAWAEGVKKFGVNWYEDGDANTYDYALQMAMLGEVRYG